MEKRTIGYLIAACLAAMIISIAYAFIRLYVMNQRIDATILIGNVGIFAVAAGIFMYLSKKQKDIEEEEMFRD